MRHLLTALYRSCYDLGWLKAEGKRPGRAWGYFFWLTLLIVLVTIVPAVVSLPRVVAEVERGITTEVPDFTARVKDGRLSVTELPQPFIRSEALQGKRVVVVVDTVTTTPLALTNYFAPDAEGLGVLITAERVEARQRDGSREQTRVQYWREAPEFSVSKQNILGWIARYRGAAVWLVGALLVAVMYLAIAIGKLVTLLLVSLLSWGIGKIARRPARFGAVFTTGLYALTLPAIIALVAPFLGLRLPYLHFIALLAFMLAVVLTKDDKAPAAVAEMTPSSPSASGTPPPSFSNSLPPSPPPPASGIN
ncbi:MAG: DUF1189 family protein [Candidatus Magasanikbacteria bacterium]|nr:DUF1189 family protein [Candidatus Magasanikbacteria bacterium]